MQLQKLVNMFGGDFMCCYGEKVYKLMLYGGFSCLNCDGMLGCGGCIFCNVVLFVDEVQQYCFIVEQFVYQVQFVNWVKCYLVYFQVYISIFVEVQVFCLMYCQVVSVVNIVGLCVGICLDCVLQVVFDLLSEYYQ